MVTILIREEFQRGHGRVARASLGGSEIGVPRPAEVAKVGGLGLAAYQVSIGGVAMSQMVGDSGVYLFPAQ